MFLGITLIAVVITLLAQLFVNSSYKKYLKIGNKRGISGEEACRYILRKNNLDDIDISLVNGYLTDHYDPTKRVIRLSRDVYCGTSIASVAVACHECGHALQDKDNYFFLRVRSKIIPVVNFCSYAGYISILLGVLFGALEWLWIGIFLELFILLFQLITLPVEVDASKRALKELDYAHILNSSELSGGRVVLTAAALTYVASVLSSLLQILRLVLIASRRRD